MQQIASPLHASAVSPFAIAPVAAATPAAYAPIAYTPVSTAPTDRRYFSVHIHCVSENVTTLSRYHFDVHESISVISGRNFTEKVSNQKMFYFYTSPN